MKVAVIGGAGAVGSTIAYTLAATVPEVELTLVDADVDAAEGHGVDVSHAGNHVAHPVGRRIVEADRASVPVEWAEPGLEAIADADCLVVVYNVARPDDAVGRGGRDEYFEHNAPVADEIADWLGTRDPCPVVVVTNPVDRIAHRIYRQSGWPRESFLAYSLSETARAAGEIGRVRDVPASEVRCPTMGVHGEQVVPVFSRTTIGGEPVDLTAEERERVRDYVREVPYQIMRKRDPDESSRWGSGRGVAAVVHALALGGVDESVCLSIPLDGEYGYEDVCLSVPVTLDGEGWTEIREWDLADEEREQLDEGYEFLREMRERAE